MGLATDAILLQFDKQRNRTIAQFHAFISQGKKQQIWHDLRHQIYLDDKAFVEKHMKNFVNQDNKLSEVSLKQCRQPAKSIQSYQEENGS